MAVSIVTNEDNMVMMGRYPDNFFDLAIVDPPYGISADIKNSTSKRQSNKSAANSKDYGSQIWDGTIPTDNYFRELQRVSKNQIIWGANYFGLKGGYIFWDKCVTMPTYSKGELAYCSILNSVQYFRYAWHGMIQPDMKNKEHRVHPTQKPVALYNYLLETYAKPGYKILDTHLGSGTHRVAASKLKLDFYACEADLDYFNSSIELFNRYESQLSPF